MNSIQAVYDFYNYLKKCASQKCYVEFNNKTYKKVDVSFHCQTNNWVIYIPEKIKLHDNLLHTDNYEMEYNENTHYLKIFTDDGTIYITSA